MRAAVTIASKNYLAMAKVLAKTYKQYHPDDDFIIVLADRFDGFTFDKKTQDYEIVEVECLPIPDIDTFVYRYSIMEFNTAVKPFALHALLELRGYNEIIYLDPDIQVFRQLTEVERELQGAAVCLIAHMRRPFSDGRRPSDLTILQSGTYNLGFIALSASAETKFFLQWWMEKLFLDCIVDIPNGLFVDQKWVDLLPGFVPTAIIRDPSYNVAYWNLHERQLDRGPSGYTVAGVPLTFFHFSGYDPYVPERLSKHQDRHSLVENAVLKRLCDEYAERLFIEGHTETSSWRYSFATLSNGVSLPMMIVRDAVQWMIRNRVRFPSPMHQPDDFCRFLVSSNSIPKLGNNIIPLFHFLLQRRGDVAQAFPDAIRCSNDGAFRKWIEDSGRQEENLDDILAFESSESEQSKCTFDIVFDLLSTEKRGDVSAAFKKMWVDEDTFDSFACWLETHGVSELGYSRTYGEAFRKAKIGFERILEIYFLRGDLQLAFNQLESPHILSQFVRWLHIHCDELNLTRDQIEFFRYRAQDNPIQIARMRFLYQHYGQPNRPAASIFKHVERSRAIQCEQPANAIAAWLASEKNIDPISQLCPTGQAPEKELKRIDRNSIIAHLAPRESFEFVERVRSRASKVRHERWVNFAGFLGASTGMGESARSNLTLLKGLTSNVADICLPSMDGAGSWTSTSVCFGWPVSCAEASITIANADSTLLAETFLPVNYWTDRNIGYWVWETESLPYRFRERADRYTEIWTPSAYSARSIQKFIDKPVKIVPHVLNFPEIQSARPDRQRFGLPEKLLLFGFFFDPNSVLERKNIKGLIKAFLSAFGPTDRVALILKSVSTLEHNLEYEQIKATAAASNNRIILMELALDRSNTFAFMASLDVYVSLHRSEGFGLTCAEAMALGIPVVATDYSGNLDFMSNDNSLLIPAKVIETEREYGPYPAGSRWADPDIDAASEAMRSLLSESYREALGKKGQQAICDKLSIKSCQSHMERALLGT